MSWPSTIASTASGSVRWMSFMASGVLVVLACLAYRFAPFEVHQHQFSHLFGVSGFYFKAGDFLAYAALVYIVALAYYYARMWDGEPSKALLAGRAVVLLSRRLVNRGSGALTPADGLALRVCLLKAFFAPMMVVSMMIFCNGAIANGLALFSGAPDVQGQGFLRGRSFWFALHLILFVDVLVFTFGYLVELPRLDNKIRSVDPTLLGWAAALMCYPPFNSITFYIVGSTISEFPQFEDNTMHGAMNALLLILMAIYAWASVAMGWKGSNLTHRGIVADGPYRFIRHPAYVCKNLAWWIGSLPIFIKAFGTSAWAGIAALVSMASISAIYLLRALTEEDHLRRVDGEYGAYSAKVPYRFIPGVI